MALVSFAPASVLNGNATVDSSLDFAPAVVGDGAGNWVAVWASPDTLGGTIDSGLDVLVARSADNGQTWSAPAAVDASTGSANPAIATDGSGVWVVVAEPDALASRSVDNGASWTAFTTLGVDVLATPDVATDGSGTWIIVGATNDDLGGTIGSDNDIVMVRSADNALTWSAPAPVNSDAAINFQSDFTPRIATDGAGTWVVVWEREDVITAATSSDDGLTWTAPVSVSVAGGLCCPDVATDTMGTWLAAWTLSNGLGGVDIVSASSFDDGATWTGPATINPTDEEDRIHGLSELATDGQGAWYAIWELLDDSFGGQLGKDTDALTSRSIDAGSSWSPASALVPNMTSDSGDDTEPQFAYDGVGSWVAVWATDEPGDGSLGADFDIFSAVSTDDCPVAPVGGCLVPTLASKSTFKAKDGKGGRDNALFKWTRGQETMLADLGDPTTTTDYLWCAYDTVSTVPRLILEKDIPAGQTCKGQPCWEATTTGFRYRDRKHEHGAVKTVTLKAALDGKAKVKVRAKGALVGLPAIPLAQMPEVQVQLHNLENGRCWEATYSTNTRNDAVLFKAKSH